MNLLISWSKPLSRTVAGALRDWLPSVLPGINPWMSSKDISKGKEWFRELQNALSECRIILICVTPDNVRSPWIYYEVGAIALKEPDVLICPYLVGVSQSMLSDGPLGQWQCTVADENDTWELIKSLNDNALSSRHEPTLLEGNYRANWPKLFKDIEPVISSELANNEKIKSTGADQVVKLLHGETSSINRKLLTPNAITILKEINDQGNLISIEPRLQGVSNGIDPYHLAQKLNISIDELLYFIDRFKEQNFLEYTMDDVLCGISNTGRAYLFEGGFLSSDTHSNNPDLFPVLNETALKKHILKKISNTPFKEIISKISLYESNVAGIKYQLIVEAPKHHKGFSHIEKNWNVENPLEDDFSDIYRKEPRGDCKTEWSCSVIDIGSQLQDSFIVKIDRWVLYRKPT